MENPATWGEAEKIVDRALRDHYINSQNQDPRAGLSLPRVITDALRDAGLLPDEGFVPRKGRGSLEGQISGDGHGD